MAAWCIIRVGRTLVLVLLHQPSLSGSLQCIFWSASMPIPSTVTQQEEPWSFTQSSSLLQHECCVSLGFIAKESNASLSHISPSSFSSSSVGGGGSGFGSSFGFLPAKHRHSHQCHQICLIIIIVSY